MTFPTYYNILVTIWKQYYSLRMNMDDGIVLQILFDAHLYNNELISGHRFNTRIVLII